MANSNDFDNKNIVTRITTNSGEILTNNVERSQQFNDYALDRHEDLNDEFNDLSNRKGLFAGLLTYLYISFDLFLTVRMFSIIHVYDRDGWIFLPNVSIRIISIVTEKDSTTTAAFPNDYL